MSDSLLRLHHYFGLTSAQVLQGLVTDLLLFSITTEPLNAIFRPRSRWHIRALPLSLLLLVKLYWPVRQLLRNSYR